MNNTVSSRCFSVARTAPAVGRVFNLPLRPVGTRAPLRIVASARQGLVMTWTVDRFSGRPVCSWAARQESVDELAARPVRQVPRALAAPRRFLARLAA